MRASFAQRCYLANVYGSYVLLVAVAAFAALRWGGVAGVVVAAAGGLGLWAYVAIFPRISPILGYGSVSDREPAVAPRAVTVVRLYTAVGCPFCPIVRRRLEHLRGRMGFALEEMDVTLRPVVLLRRGIHAVPVVEVDGRVHVGHATTAELASLIAGSPP